MLTRIELQPARVLHTRPYRDTSLLVDWLTRDYGRVRTLARNARGLTSRFKGILQPFIPFLISWSGKTELVNLQQAELAGTPNLLVGEALLSGLYLNELLLRLLAIADPHPQLYEAYQNTLQQLQQTVNLELTLRLFEKQLLQELGYGLALDKDTLSGEAIEAQGWYLFDPRQGLSRTLRSQHHSAFHGKHLLALHRGKLQDQEDLQAAKRLMRLLLAPLLGDKPLRSRELFFSPLGRI